MKMGLVGFLVHMDRLRTLIKEKDNFFVLIQIFRCQNEKNDAIFIELDRDLNIN